MKYFKTGNGLVPYYMQGITMKGKDIQSTITQKIQQMNPGGVVSVQMTGTYVTVNVSYPNGQFGYEFNIIVVNKKTGKPEQI
jgi:hypothetical protein